MKVTGVFDDKQNIFEKVVKLTLLDIFRCQRFMIREDTVSHETFLFESDAR